MWCTELIQWVLFVACVVGLVVVWRNRQRLERVCNEAIIAYDLLLREHDKLRQDRDDLADDLEWLWDELPEDHWLDFWDRSSGDCQRALKVAAFVKASFEAQQRENAMRLQAADLQRALQLDAMAACGAPLFANIFPPGAWLSERIGFSFP